MLHAYQKYFEIALKVGQGQEFENRLRLMGQYIPEEVLSKIFQDHGYGYYQDFLDDLDVETGVWMEKYFQWLGHLSTDQWDKIINKRYSLLRKKLFRY